MSKSLKELFECFDAEPQQEFDWGDQPRWIPVEDRLPEDGQYVLVALNSEVVFCDSNFMDSELKSSNDIGIEVVEFKIINNEYKIWLGVWCAYENNPYKTEVLAWMSLPKPYKEVQKDD